MMAVVGMRLVVAVELDEMMSWIQCGAGVQAAAESGLRC